MNVFWWCVTVILMAGGLAGTILPFLPGSTIILAAAVLHHFTVKTHTVGWWTILALALLTLLSYAVDLAGGVVGAKYYGATKWGAIGGIIGTIVGLFFGIPGIFIGPLAGVLAGELLGGKGLLPAGRSTWGTFLGTTASIAVRFLIGLAMVGWFAIVALRK